MNTQSVNFDSALIAKYNISGPRYTSYPTAVKFHQDFTAADYRREAIKSNERGGPLSLYLHIPFCSTVCFYCACSKIITANRRHAAPYLQRVHKEIALQSALFSSERAVKQLHWGGGTPTFISHAQMRQLMRKTRDHFQLLDDDGGEYSVEVDPREATPATLALLRELGFNRLSIGVQDFHPPVQKAVNRIQSRAITEQALSAARREGYRSISMDLIYGLPHQTVTSFDRTLGSVIDLAPDRLSVFNYAHLPRLFKVQRQIDTAALPAAEQKLIMFRHIIERLTGAGYVYIGMDHFARPDDELAQAQQQGTLHRNFQGYSTNAECDLIGLGMTAIGRIADCYGQNAKTLTDYYAALDADCLPLSRGIVLDEDDKIRRAIITRLICHFALDFGFIESRYGINFRRYFAAELGRLDEMQSDGLLELQPDAIMVFPSGRLMIRNICMVFDRYLPEQTRQQFSNAL